MAVVFILPLLLFVGLITSFPITSFSLTLLNTRSHFDNATRDRQDTPDAYPRVAIVLSEDYYYYYFPRAPVGLIN